MEWNWQFVLPGDEIDPSNVPTHKNRALRLGPGLQLVPPSDIVPTVAGQLMTDRKKTSMWVEYSGGRYNPTASDLVIGQIHHSATDAYLVSLSPHGPLATLPHLAFEGATKKTRPQLAPGQLVYARVSLALRHVEPELECATAAAAGGGAPGMLRAEGLGPLVGGTAVDVSLGLARRLLMAGGKSGVVVLEELGAAGLAFETAVGRNGRVWVNSDKVRTVVLVCRAIKETDEKRLDVDAQKKLVRRLLKEGT